ncbi:MAG TPA: HDOD domain-containing protein [Verrucomicrobiae bacterium]
MSNLAEQLEQIPFFPPGVQVFPKLLPLLGDNQYPTDELAEVVRVDSGLTADILRVCNSAAFGFRVRAQTVQEAIQRLGLREVYTITSKVVAAPILHSGSHDNLLEGVDLWNHSLATAAAALVLAHAKGFDPEVAFTVGLLHDVGKVRLVQTVGPEYAEMIRQSRQGQPLYILEAQKWRIDHAVIGGQLLKKWLFPDNMRDALLLHHSVMGSTPNLNFAALINLADHLAGAVGFPYDRLAPLESINPRALQLLSLSPQELEELHPKVVQVFLRERTPFNERR